MISRSRRDDADYRPDLILSKGAFSIGKKAELAASGNNGWFGKTKLAKIEAVILKIAI
jgi:hypothetical protein